jgi:eukaryotic-like serine/threonine-protein kinase
MDTPKKIGRYEILGELGHGAMGTVYRAKDPSMDRVVAVKTIISLILASEQGTEFRERFSREARAAGALAHPGIVPVFDVGEHEGLPFLVMEFITGKTLADALKKNERMTLDRVCEIGQRVAEALGYAHQRGVVHRDIKPANILITSKEAHGIERPKITDFGVAKLAAGNTTMTGQMVGTPAFMPPEQFTGAPVDGRSDIFSLGVVLYWMATGEQPFPGESMTAVSYKVVHTEPVPPRKLNPSISAKLESIILKCLAKSPEDRYQTGEDLARDLGELRTVSSATGLKAPAIQAAIPGNDPNATLMETFAPTQPARTAAQPLESPVARKNNLHATLILTTAAIALIGIAGLFLLRHKAAPAAQASSPLVVAAETPNAQLPAPPVVTGGESAASPAAEAGATATPAAMAPPTPKPAAAAPKKLEAKAPAAEKTPPPTAEPPLPELAVLDFNPKQLDPKNSARLKIEANHVPANLDFTVEMNGKLYMRRSAEGNKAEFDDFYVPPGVQEFRVTATNGSMRKSSNTVSTEFKAKKRHTLKLELRSQGSRPGEGIPQDLYPDTQVVLTLK